MVNVRNVIAVCAAMCSLNAGIAFANETDPTELVRRLEQHPDPQAWIDIKSMGDRAVPAVIAGLESSNKETRQEFARLLGKMKSDKAVPALAKMAQSKESLDFDVALDALAKIGGPEAAEAIISGFPRMDPYRQEIYCRALGAIGDNCAIAPLAEVLSSSGGMRSGLGEGTFKIRARVAAAEALGRFRDPRARAALLKALREEPDWEAYRAAEKSLYLMDGEQFGYEELKTEIALAVAKEPEPREGAEAYILKWKKEAASLPPPGPSWRGPTLELFASKKDIERARDFVVQRARLSETVELLIEYMCNRKWPIEEPENAKALLIRIGKPALPALEVGVQRGDFVLARNCKECIDAINK